MTYINDSASNAVRPSNEQVCTSFLCTNAVLNRMVQADDVVTLEMVEGHLQIKDRANDYINRGNLLENWSFLDFFLGTYEGHPLKNKDSTRGRKPSVRVPYREGSGRDSRCRIIKSPGHKTMPYFPGRWFPKQDLEDENGLFEASMLALLKPW